VAFHLDVKDAPAARWHNIISIRQDLESSPPQGAMNWLSGKFLPTISSKTTYERDGVMFQSSFIGRFDDMPSSTDVGLVVFEAPISSWDSRKKAQ